MIYIKKIFSILTKKNKIDFSLIVFFSIFKTILEIIGIGLLLPIFSIISNSEKKDEILNYFFFIDKEISNEKIVILFFFLFIFIYLIKSIFTVFINNYISRFCQNLYKHLAEKLLKKYLNNKYIFFTHNNSAELIKNIASETNGFAIGSVGACITIFSNFFLLFGICLFLFLYEYHTIFIILILFTIFSIAINLNKKKFKKWGEVRNIESSKMIKRLNELIGSIKEIILYNKRDFFVSEVITPLKNFSDSLKYKDQFSYMTGPLIEFATIFTFFVFFLYLNIFSNMKFPELIVFFGIFSYSSLRLLPNLIGLAKATQTLSFNFPAINLIYDALTQDYYEDKIKNTSKIENIYSISFQKAEFIYPEKKYPILKNVNLRIEAGDKIAVIGETGSGKTTLINLISGLVFPTKGQISINSSKISDFEKIKLNIGYVSQSVYISDDDIFFNISLSRDIPKNRKNFIFSLLNNLNLNNFTNKKNIYKSLGERGLKMSGGQIQRIGIARALYREPSLLILDEATNALDEKTEEKILSYLFKEFKDKIVIICTHKKKILKFCNKIIEVKDQKVNILK
jgi:ABC-type bacteriocin/lantibiotic exporter with double-glycine peptidase domain